jgi:hypothetical protein
VVETALPDHSIDLQQELYRDQEATVRTESGEMENSKIEKKNLPRGCLLSPSKFNVYAEVVIKRADMEEAEEQEALAGMCNALFRASQL